MATRDEKIMLGELSGKVDMLVGGAKEFRQEVKKDIDGVYKKIDECISSLPCSNGHCPMNGGRSAKEKGLIALLASSILALIAGGYFT